MLLNCEVFTLFFTWWTEQMEGGFERKSQQKEGQEKGTILQAVLFDANSCLTT